MLKTSVALIAVVVPLALVLSAGSAASQGGSGVPVQPRWVRIPAGSFEMGCVPGDQDCGTDERPRHHVAVTRAFDLLATEVTLGEFHAAGLRGPEQPSWNTDSRQPVVAVTWSEATAYCEATGGRLPTEAEWEYAARGGADGRKFVWGDGPIPLVSGVKQANVADETAKAVNPRWQNFFAGYEDGYAFTAPAGSFAANDYGLYDMAGNVWEWVSDWYSESYYQLSPGANPKGPSFGTTRVLRGGCWDPKPVDLRVSNRLARDPAHRDDDFGIRCARDVRVGDR